MCVMSIAAVEEVLKFSYSSTSTDMGKKTDLIKSKPGKTRIFSEFVKYKR